MSLDQLKVPKWQIQKVSALKLAEDSPIDDGITAGGGHFNAGLTLV